MSANPLCLWAAVSVLFLAAPARAGSCWGSTDGESYSRYSPTDLEECRRYSGQIRYMEFMFVNRISVDGLDFTKVTFLKEGRVLDSSCRL